MGRAIQRKPGVVVYDLLGQLGKGPALETGLKLIALAGQIGTLAGGYFYEKRSASEINTVSETPVYDETGELVGTIESPGLFFHMVLLGKDRRFDTTRHRYCAEPKIEEAQVRLLWDLRDAIREELRNRGKEAREEYALVSGCMGAKGMTADEAQKMIEDALALREKKG